MNVKSIIFASILLVVAPTFAKGLNVGEAKKIEIDATQGVYHPVLSDDGSKLLYSSEDYTGLVMMDMATGETEVISDKIGAGDSPFFMDGNTVICHKAIEYKGKLQYRGVDSYSTITKSSEVVVPGSREKLTLAKSVKGATVLSGATVSNETEIYAYSKRAKIIVAKGAKQIELTPIEGALSYLWVSISPSGDKLLFVEPYNGVFVCDLNGDNLVSYGQGDFPVWYGDDYIILAKTKDDGHLLLESRLYLVNVETKSLIALTSAEQKANEASGSIESETVVYSTDNGEMFSVNVKVVE